MNRAREAIALILHAHDEYHQRPLEDFEGYHERTVAGFMQNADWLIAALKDAGLIIVPREPTDAMCGFSLLDLDERDREHVRYVEDSALKAVYRAMLKVAEGEVNG